jgi:heme-degrading monooxygenase HmoA
MPVLEVTQLGLKGLSADDPQLLPILADTRDKLQTKSQFYTCLEDATKLYILGIWRDLKHHLDFLASPARDEILGPQENLLEFQWSVHIELDGMNSLPLDAPILAIERLSVEEGHVARFDQAAKQHVKHLQGSHPLRPAYGWRCDLMTGSREALLFSGWESVQAHITFSAQQQRQGDTDAATMSGHYETILVHHCKNLEREEN